MANYKFVSVRDKEAFNVFEIFHIRWLLHHQVYQQQRGTIPDTVLRFLITQLSNYQ